MNFTLLCICCSRYTAFFLSIKIIKTFLNEYGCIQGVGGNVSIWSLSSIDWGDVDAGDADVDDALKNIKWCSVIAFEEIKSDLWLNEFNDCGFTLSEDCLSNFPSVRLCIAPK